MGDIFDQVASGQSPTQPSQPGNAPPVPVANNGGDIFDQVASDQNSTSNSQPPAPHTDELRTNPNDNLLVKGLKIGPELFEGIGEGVFGTAAGASDIIDKATGMTPGAVNSYLHKVAGDQNTTHGTMQSIGLGAEDAMEFILGDEALKALPLSERFVKAAKLSKLIEEHPLLNRVVQAGVRAIRGGTVAGVQGEIKSGGDTPAALVAGSAGAAGSAIVPEVFDAAKYLKSIPLSLKALQPRIQGAIATAIKDAAQEHGIALPENASVRDITQHLSDALRTKARAIYQSLDNALGGTRFQVWDEQLGNIQRAIRESLGVDPEKDAALAKRLQDVTNARNAAMDEIRSKGLDPNGMIDRADSLHRQSMALSDVSKAIRASTDVHPSLEADPYKGNSAAKNLDLAINGKPASGEAPANVRTKPMFTRMQQLATPNPKYPGTPSRLVQALGEQRAQALLNEVDAAHLMAQKIAARNVWLRRGATALGLAGLGREVFEGAHALLSGQ